MYRTCAALLLVLFVSSIVRAEGLIYQLPPDGHWASYAIEDTVTDADGTKTTVTGELIVSSVGVETVNGKPCRWIEIAVLFDGGYDVIDHIDKLLIPEESLQKGKQPLKQVYKLHRQYGKDRRILRIEDREKLQQLPDKANTALRMFLHGPYKEWQHVPDEVIESKLGEQNCEGIRATETTKRRNISDDAEYIIRLHPEAPFGVVQWKVHRKIERDGQPDGTIDHELTLSDFGTGAKTALPDEK